jgi:hypothetical protein
MKPRLILLPVALLLAGLMNGTPSSANAAAQRVCFGCTDDSCTGTCSCWPNFGRTCEHLGYNLPDKSCGTVGEE